MNRGPVKRRLVPALALAAALIAAAVPATRPRAQAPAENPAYQAACRAFDRNDFATALHGLMPFAKGGDAAAQFFVAEALRMAGGSLADPAAAAAWYRKAAEQGHRAAQCNLGLLYFKGQGVPQDFDEARRWWTKAAEAGDSTAQYNLAVLYARGEGTARNAVLAYIWLTVAESQGMSEAHAARVIVRKTLTPAQFAAAKDVVEHMVPAGTPIE